MKWLLAWLIWHDITDSGSNSSDNDGCGSEGCGCFLILLGLFLLFFH